MNPSDMPPVASLSKDQVAKLQQIERSLGDVVVVAYQPPTGPANLSPDQLDALQDAERELGVCLIAYQKPQ